VLGILGLGAFGSSLANAAAANSTEVFLWGKSDEVAEARVNRVNTRYLPGVKLADNINIIDDLEIVIDKCRDLLISVPSFSFREILQKIVRLAKPDTRIAWITKGLEPQTGRLLSTVVEEIFGKDRVYGLLSGPSFAKEIASKIPTAIVASCNNEQFAEDLVSYFQQDWFKIYINNDLIGVQLGGACKNIYAVAAGILDGLKHGANTKAALITRSLAELSLLAVALGAKANTVMGLAVCGDLILTCTDDQSRNRRFGLNIGKGMSIELAAGSLNGVVEAVHNSTEICQLAEKHNVYMPIADMINKVLNGAMPANKLITSLLNLEIKYES
jgi:glycerol-3-phosphate dehydrogenase (NAD(P)+)